MYSVKIWLLTAIIVVQVSATGQAGKLDELANSLLKKGIPNLPSNPGTIIKKVDSRQLPSLKKPGNVEIPRHLDEFFDSSTRKTFQALDKAEKTALLDLLGASKRVLKGRSADESVALLRMLDGDGLLQVKTYGDTVIEGVERMGPGFKDVVRKMSDGSIVFYQNVIRPHWKKWTAAGLTAAYLAAPERFHDTVGDLTAGATEELTKAGIQVGEGIVQGVVNGIWARLENNPVYATIALLLIGGVVMFQIPLFRYWLTHVLLRPLWNVPTPDKSTSSDRTTSLNRQDFEE